MSDFLSMWAEHYHCKDHGIFFMVSDHSGVLSGCPVCEIERLRAALERIANNEDCRYASCGVIAREALRDD